MLVGLEAGTEMEAVVFFCAAACAAIPSRWDDSAGIAPLLPSVNFAGGLIFLTGRLVAIVSLEIIIAGFWSAIVDWTERKIMLGWVHEKK